MDASAPCSSKTARVFGALAIVGVLVVSGCVDQLPPISGTTSLQVKLLSPTDTGSKAAPLGDNARTVTVSITALDQDGKVDTSFSGKVDFYVHYLGSLSPSPDSGKTLATVDVTKGTAGPIKLTFPPVFGPVFVWAENTRGSNPTYATGTSPTLWYRNPYVTDIQTPATQTLPDALETKPLDSKQLLLTSSQYGAAGRLVVTGVYAQGYTLSDVKCQDATGTPPCTVGPYGSLFVFAFSRPETGSGELIKRGDVISRLTGGIGPFNGLTEINFPQSFVGKGGDPSLVPAPVAIQKAWLATPLDMEKVESALVSVKNGTVCPLDADYTSYSQWKLNVGNGCGQPIDVISTGVAPGFNPADYVGKVIPKVVGTMRPVEINTFYVWIVYPRDADDLTLPAS